MYISLILAIAILFSILFGCSYRKENYREYFEDKKTEEEKTPAKTQPPTDMKQPTNANSKQPDPDANLSDDEKQLKKDIKGGKVDEKQLQTFIDNNKITTKNLENIIQSFQQELFSNKNQ